MEPTAAPPGPAEPAPRLPLGQRLKALMEEYGPLALIVYLGTFVVGMAFFSAAIVFGLKIESVSGTGGTLLAAWVATKATQPLRIAATVVLTPVVGRLWHRFRSRA